LLFLGFAVRRVITAIKNECGVGSLRTRYLAQLISCSLFILDGSYNPVVVGTKTAMLFYLIALGEPKSA
jgi:hypothetical protein